MAVLGNRATGLLDMAIEAFRDRSMPNEQLAPTAPGQGTVLAQPPVVQVAPQRVATIETNPELNQAPSMPLGEGVRMTPEMSSDADMARLAEEANKAVSAVQANPEIANDPSFMDYVKRFFGDRERMVKLALAFNTMRLTPDQGLAATLGSELKGIREQKLIDSRSNATLKALRDAGVPEKDLQVLAQDPAILREYAKKFFAKQLGTVPAEQQAFEELIKDMSPADQEKARRIKAGLDPRAGSQFALTLEELFARSAAQAGGQVKGKTEEERAQEQVMKNRTWNLWTNAARELEQDLLGTSTGFGFGMVPAMFESQQLADAAVSRMAPILKNIFRESGEGVFTDQDQALLLGMIPDRGTSPAAVRKIMQSINMMVALKLNQPVDIQAPQSAPTGGAVLRFDAQGNPIQ